MPYHDDRMDLTDHRYRDFLDKLVGDDDFRGELQSRPGEILRQYGIPHDPDRVPETLELLPKGEIQAHVGEYLEDLCQGVCLAAPFPVFPKRK